MNVKAPKFPKSQSNTEGKKVILDELGISDSTVHYSVVLAKQYSTSIKA